MSRTVVSITRPPDPLFGSKVEAPKFVAHALDFSAILTTEGPHASCARLADNDPGVFCRWQIAQSSDAFRSMLGAAAYGFRTGDVGPQQSLAVKSPHVLEVAI